MDDPVVVARLIQTIKNYQDDSMNKMSYMQRLIRDSSDKHKRILLQSGLDAYLSDIFNCIESNHLLLNQILEAFLKENEPDVAYDQGSKTLALDHQRLLSSLLQVVREWSKTGEEERQVSYGAILEELKQHFPDEESRDELNVLVPGCGLSRLPYEIANEGFTCVGNEVDPFQLSIASYIMNHCSSIEQCKIYPWIHDLSNKLERQTVLEPVHFPDINPSQRSEDLRMSIMPGDFRVMSEDVQDETVDVIVTCFFLETAANPLEYIDIIHKMLKEGGLWINFGSWNQPEASNKPQVLLSLDMLKNIIVNSYSFEMIQEQMVQSTYAKACDQKTTKVTLDCAFFTCKKK